jgi:hypothetical protein
MSKLFKRGLRFIPLEIKILTVLIGTPPILFLLTHIAFNRSCPIDPLACDDCNCPSNPNCPGKLKRAAHAAKLREQAKRILENKD